MAMAELPSRKAAAAVAEHSASVGMEPRKAALLVAAAEAAFLVVAGMVPTRQEAGAAVLCTTHDLPLAQSCKEILVLNEGRLIKKGPPNDILTADLIKLIGNK
jgi:ABC-type hemin transport system ATPase subunit